MDEGTRGNRCPGCGARHVTCGEDQELLRLRGTAKVLEAGEGTGWRQVLLLTLDSGQQLPVETAPESVVRGELGDGPVELLGEATERFGELQPQGGLRQALPHTRVLRARYLCLGAQSEAGMEAIIAELRGEPVAREPETERLPEGVEVNRLGGGALTISVGGPFPSLKFVFLNTLAAMLLMLYSQVVALTGLAWTALFLSFLVALFAVNWACLPFRTVIKASQKKLSRWNILSLPSMLELPADEVACLRPRGTDLWLEQKSGRGRVLLQRATKDQMTAVRELLEQAMGRSLVRIGEGERMPDPRPTDLPEHLIVKDSPAGELDLAHRPPMIGGLLLGLLPSLGLLTFAAILIVSDEVEPVARIGSTLVMLALIGGIQYLIAMAWERTEVEIKAGRLVVRWGMLRRRTHCDVATDRIAILLHWDGTLGVLLRDGEVITVFRRGGDHLVDTIRSKLQRTLGLPVRYGTELEKPGILWRQRLRVWGPTAAVVVLALTIVITGLLRTAQG